MTTEKQTIAHQFINLLYANNLWSHKIFRFQAGKFWNKTQRSWWKFTRDSCECLDFSRRGLDLKPFLSEDVSYACSRCAAAWEACLAGELECRYFSFSGDESGDLFFSNLSMKSSCLCLPEIGLASASNAWSVSGVRDLFSVDRPPPRFPFNIISNGSSSIYKMLMRN